MILIVSIPYFASMPYKFYKICKITFQDYFPSTLHHSLLGSFYLCIKVSFGSFPLRLKVSTFLLSHQKILKSSFLSQLKKKKTMKDIVYETAKVNIPQTIKGIMYISCTKLALSASWTQGLIAQSVRASERNSVVVYIFIYLYYILYHIYIYIYTYYLFLYYSIKSA